MDGLVLGIAPGPISQAPIGLIKKTNTAVTPKVTRSRTKRQQVKNHLSAMVASRSAIIFFFAGRSMGDLTGPCLCAAHATSCLL